MTIKIHPLLTLLGQLSAPANSKTDKSFVSGGDAMKRILILTLNLGFALMFALGCGEDDPVIDVGDETYNPVINPADFVEQIDNQYLPMTPGTTFVYDGESEDGKEKIEVNVTHETKEILGVTCIVVRDRVWVDDELVEDTFDWFAQDIRIRMATYGTSGRTQRNTKVVRL